MLVARALPQPFHGLAYVRYGDVVDVPVVGHQASLKELAPGHPRRDKGLRADDWRVRPIIADVPIDPSLGGAAAQVEQIVKRMIYSLIIGNWVFASVLALWWQISRSAKLLPHLRRRPSSFFYIPGYVAVSWLMALIKIRALLTIRTQR